nr:putative ribonuclease H-like domain-containing protein [Tanacetum cinerariifolium]
PKTSNSVSEDISNKVKESLDTPLVKELVSDDKLEKKTIFLTVAKIEFVRPKQQEKPVRKPVKYVEMYRLKVINTARPNSAVVNAVRANQINVFKGSTCWVWRPTKLNSALITLKKHNYIDARGRSKSEKRVIDSGCSRHMTRNMSYLSECEEIDGGYVAFGGDPKGGKITGKGKISTSKLDFADTLNVLTKSMNYKPVVARNQSNGNAGEEEKKDAKDPWNEDNEVLSIEEPRVNQEKEANVNNTKNINTVSPTDNAAGIKDNVVDKDIVYGCVNDPNMPNLEEIVNLDDDEDQVWILVDLPYGKRAIGTKWIYKNKKDERAYSDSDYAGASLDKKSTIGGCQFLGCRLISWKCKKQTVVATSSTEAEYVAAASCCAQ